MSRTNAGLASIYDNGLTMSGAGRRRHHAGARHHAGVRRHVHHHVVHVGGYRKKRVGGARKRRHHGGAFLSGLVAKGLEFAKKHKLASKALDLAQKAGYGRRRRRVGGARKRRVGGAHRRRVMYY